MLLAVASMLVVMAALRRMINRDHLLLASMRVVPATSKNRMDEQQGCRQIRDKRLHGPQGGLLQYPCPNRPMGQATLRECCDHVPQDGEIFKNSSNR
ncbi:MAG: hypothetical protein JF612_04005 [Planctomycetia bacterium]|nr:hypothetical protein [Planctomycetia bacterium]